MFRTLLLSLAVTLCLAVNAQVRIDSSDISVFNAVQKEDLIKSSYVAIDSIDSKTLKKQVRKARKNKVKGSSLITFVEIKQNTPKNHSINSESQSFQKNQLPVRPGFRPVSKEQMEMLKAEQRRITNTQPNRRIVNMLNYKATTKTSNNQRLFWVVEEIKNGSSSHKSMKLVNLRTAQKMITKNKTESKTRLGKHNDLTVWEVYDGSAFMKLKRENPDYASLEKASCFNVESFYKTNTAK